MFYNPVIRKRWKRSVCHVTVYEDLSMDMKTDNATSSSPWQLSQKWNFSQYQRCLALPWAFTALVQWKKSQLSWFRRPLFLCIGGGEDRAEYKLLQGYCPNSSLSVLHTPSSATLLVGWGMGSKGAQQDEGVWGVWREVQWQIHLIFHQSGSGWLFLSTSSGGYSVTTRLGDSTDSFVSKHVDAEE